MTLATPVRAGVSLDELLAAKSAAQRARLTCLSTINNR